MPPRRLSDEERQNRRRASYAAWKDRNPGRAAIHNKRYRERMKTEDPKAYSDQTRRNSLASRKRHPDRIKARNQRSNLKRYYGMTVEEYDAMLVAQDSKCALCGRLPEQSLHNRLHVDHDHETMVIRGLLCYRCNAALGQFGDSISGVQRVINYLIRAERHGRKIA